nr:Chain M, COMPASS component SDC1 [Saccharomyces cerevisiae S288C]6BX3_N Chain N, COMPASS component SDC1 [Saccharomyces cerevisiae S288C]
TRKYLNTNVTPHLLAGMRLIAVQQPEDPLRVLGEYLIEQSNI